MCRVALSAVAGCAVCDPLRKHLVVVGEDEEDRPSLSGTASEAVAMLRAQLKAVRRDLDNNPASMIAEKRGIALSNALAKLLETARKMQADGTAAVESLSFQERKELFIGWYADLAPVYRNSVREAFAQYEADLSKPMAEVTLS